MKEDLKRSVGFFRATALGGLLFLLPLAVVVVLLGYVYSFVVVIYEPLKEWVPVHDAAGLALLFGVAVLLLVFGCFAAGLMAHRAIGQRISDLIEKYLTTFIPKYAIFKDLLAGNIGGTFNVPSLKPILVDTPDCQRIAFESERLNDGSVVVFFPGAPDTWIGHVGIVAAEKVKPLDTRFNDVVGVLEQLGRDSGEQLN